MKNILLVWWWFADLVEWALLRNFLFLLTLMLAIAVGPQYIDLLDGVADMLVDRLVSEEEDDDDDNEQSDDPRTDLIMLRNLLAVATLIGLPFVLVRAFIAERQARAAEGARDDNRLVRAIEQLGAEKTVKSVDEGETCEESVVEFENGEEVKRTLRTSPAGSREVTLPNLEVRLGAVALLEQIARDSRRDHWAVMEAFCAYLRNNGVQNFEAPPNHQKVYADPLETLNKWVAELPQPDSVRQAVLTAIARRPLRRILRDEHIAAPPQYFLRSRQRLSLEAADLRHFRAYEAQLGEAILFKAHLEGAELSWAHLERADLSWAHLQGADMQGAHLWRAKMPGAHLEGAILSEADLRQANLSEAHLEGATLSAANLTKANLSAANLEGATLSEATLRRADLSTTRLEKADLSEANLGGARLLGANLQRANLSRANLVGANLSGANLARADLSRADLERADLSRAYLDETSLFGAHLKGVIGLPSGFAQRRRAT